MNREQRNFQTVDISRLFASFDSMRMYELFNLKFLGNSVFMVLAEIRLFIGVDKS